MPHSALGLIETRGLVGAIEATDAAVKAADVTVASQESVGSGYVAVVIQGTLGDVQAAVEAARLAAEKAGQLVAAKVIARPSGAVADLFAGPKEKRARAAKRPSAATRKAPPAETRSPAAAEPHPLPRPVSPAEEREEAPVRSSVNWSELEDMPVVKLRQFARTVNGLTIQGREISMANKQQLLEAIRTAIAS